MSNKKLTERLNHELDVLGVPQLMTERVQACSKMFELPKYQVEAILSGIATKDISSVEKVATELEVNKDWLLGLTNKKTKH